MAVLVILASGVSLYRAQRESNPQINLKPFKGIGLVGAEEVVKLLGGRGRLVVVAHEVKTEPTEAVLTAFTSELKKHSGVSVTAIERVAVKLKEMSMPEAGMTEEFFFQLLEKHHDVDAIVSFLGAPFFADQDYRQVPARRPQFVVIGGYSPEIRRLMEAGIVNLALTPRFEPAVQTDREPETPREWFDRFYMVVTGKTIDLLPNF